MLVSTQLVLILVFAGQGSHVQVSRGRALSGCSSGVSFLVDAAGYLEGFGKCVDAAFGRECTGCFEELGK